MSLGAFPGVPLKIPTLVRVLFSELVLNWPGQRQLGCPGETYPRQEDRLFLASHSQPLVPGCKGPGSSQLVPWGPAAGPETAAS